jgi:hypothetical protein
MIRTYSDLRRLNTLEERFHYLSLRGQVGDATFGFDRYMNQQFYHSYEWKLIRDHVIRRDNGCDLGVEDHIVPARPVIHHMNPMMVTDIRDGNEDILDPEFLIMTVLNTHNAIHYGDVRLLPKPMVARRSGDTDLWTRTRRTR